MPPEDSFVAYVLEQLEGLGPVTAKRMFGAHGLYRGGAFFAIVHEGRLYLKTDDAARARYEARGMGPFRPNAKQTLRSYHEVPEDVLDDRETLVAWARDALRA